MVAALVMLRMAKKYAIMKTTDWNLEEMNMKKFRTVACIIIMVIAAIAGFFIGAFLDEAMGGAILFSMIAGIACIIYNIENREE